MLGRPSKSSMPLPWVDIRALWEAGSSTGAIEARYAVTGRGVQYRAVREGWDRAARMKQLIAKGKEPNEFFRVPRDLPEPTPVEEQTLAERSSVQAWTECLERVSRPAWGEMFPKAPIAMVLHGIVKCIPFGMACERAGVGERVTHNYRQREPRLDQMFLQARAMAAESMIDKIRGDKDWRSAAWLLERGIAKAEFRQDEQSGGEKLVIEIKVTRDDAIAAAAGVVDLAIDVTPDAGVSFEEMSGAIVPLIEEKIPEGLD